MTRPIKITFNMRPVEQITRSMERFGRKRKQVCGVQIHRIIERKRERKGKMRSANLDSSRSKTCDHSIRRMKMNGKGANGLRTPRLSSYICRHCSSPSQDCPAQRQLIMRETHVHISVKVTTTRRGLSSRKLSRTINLAGRRSLEEN